MRDILFKSRTGSDQALALMLITLGVFARLLPHPDNFTPVTAIALFAGTVLPPSLALTVPLLLMMASDLFLGPYSLFWLVWLYFAFVSLVGGWIRPRAGVPAVALGALGSSVLFFVVSNLGVFFVDKMYPMSLEGLVQCFTMALPFLRNSLLGDIFYTAVLFGLFEWARRKFLVPSRS